MQKQLLFALMLVLPKRVFLNVFKYDALKVSLKVLTANKCFMLNWQELCEQWHWGKTAKFIYWPDKCYEVLAKKLI